MNYSFSKSYDNSKIALIFISSKGSPLKAIQGTAIKDLTDSRFGPPKLGPWRSPRQRPIDISQSPSASSLEPLGLRLSSVSFETEDEN